MKIKRNKKGFTIIELVIVIAVIGVLAAVLIPTFINLTARANETSDDYLIKNLNTVLATKEQEPDYETTTYQKVIDIVDEAGYKIPNLVSRSGEDLFWNQKSNRFYLGSKLDNQYPKYTYWTIKDALDGTEEYSVYAGLNFRATSAKNLKAGFDVGSNAHIKEVDYVGTASQQKGVTFRFLNEEYNADFKNNNNNEDEVKVYGNANSVNSEKSGQHSLYIYEDIASLEVKEGHVVVAPGVKIGSLIFKTTSENTFDKIVVEIPDVNSQVDTIFRSGVSTNLEPGTKVEVATIKTSQKSETYFLSGNGTIEDSKLLVSTTGRVEDAAPVTEITASDAARAIANAKDPDTGDVIDTGKTADEIETVKEVAQAEIQTEVAERKAEESGEDFSKYEARIGLKGYDSYKTAISQAQAGETVTLLKDVTTNSIIYISKDLIIEGNGFCLTDTNASSGRTFRVNENNVHFTIRNLELNGSNKSQRAVQVDSNIKPAFITIRGCDIHGYTYYAINFCSYTTVDLLLVDSKVTGWAAVNAYGEGNVFTIRNCELIGINDKGYNAEGWNDFATICLEGDSTGETSLHSSDYIINVENTKVVASQTTGNVQVLLGFNPMADNCAVNFSNCEFEIGEGCHFGYNVGNLNNKLFINDEEIEMPYNQYFDILLEA